MSSRREDARLWNAIVELQRRGWRIRRLARHRHWLQRREGRVRMVDDGGLIAFERQTRAPLQLVLPL